MNTYVKYAMMLCFSVFVSMVILGNGCKNLTGSNHPDPTPTPTPTPTPVPILQNGQLVPGYGMGVDDSQHRRNWVSPTADSRKIQYPSGLDWGAVFITVGGDPVPPPNRPFKNCSQYSRLRIEMKGDVGGECVRIGMKDTNDADDGLEMLIPRTLTAAWQVYEFNLTGFTTCDLNRVYVVTEFVFPCTGQNRAQTIDVRRIAFSE